jgi:hypothetical protein
MSHLATLHAVLATSHTLRHVGGGLLILIGVLVWIGWPVVAAIRGEDVVQSHARLGYLIGDMTLLAPLCISSGYGLVQDYRWGPLVLLLTVGTAAYDLTHFLVYLGQRAVPPISAKPLPWYACAAAIVLTLAALGVLAWHELKVSAHASGPEGSGLFLVPILIVVGAAASGVLTWWLLRRAARAGLPR